MLAPALEAAESLDAPVANMRFVKPLDEELVLRLAREHTLLVTVEENVIQGGAGSAVAECLAQHGVAVAMLHLGLPDTFIEQGEHAHLLAECGLDTAGLVRSVQAALRKA
jgi:1-deoxy-D-xylulose-5-phosphate synthase